MNTLFADVNCNSTIVKCNTLPHPNTANSLHIILNIVFGVTASIALLMIVIAGFRYIIAKGDPNSTAQAKNSILYAVVGLLVTMAAYSIVLFVVKGTS